MKHMLKTKKFEIVLVIVALSITVMMYVFVHRQRECNAYGCKAPAAQQHELH